MTMIGVCGDDCSCCPRYIATQTRSLEEFEKVKQLWVRFGFRDATFPAKDLACDGCSPDIHCAYPELCACANKHAIENCGLCEEYPCGLMEEAFAETSDLL